jgi:peptide/nickel transport system ATP-binding protein/oligopeptide transport system ATP-binding protein
MPIVRLENVTKTFQRGHGPVVHAVNGVSLDIEAGETVALIGESGSGKSTIARLALRLYEPDSGVVEFDGKQLDELEPKELRSLRARMTIVFQEPYESLNPRRTVGRTVEEPLVIHFPALSRAERRARVAETMERVALDDSYYGRYPHEMSGGQQQRVGIARAIVTQPKLIVLDEPTSSLDLSVRAQILDLLSELQTQLNLTYLFVSHDIHTVEYISNRICVLYLGQVVETGRTADVFAAPKHPYTQALLSSTLSADPRIQKERLLLEGEIPSATELPIGCFFYGRCPIGTPDCGEQRVPLHDYTATHEVACIKVPWMSEAVTTGSHG